MKREKANKVALPAGFSPIQGGQFADVWDMQKNPVLVGRVTDIKELKKGGKIKKDTRIVTIETADGKSVSVWQSAAIKAAIDTAEELGVGKCEMALAYAGEKKIKGQRNPMHDISVGVRPLAKGKRAK